MLSWINILLYCTCVDVYVVFTKGIINCWDPHQTYTRRIDVYVAVSRDGTQQHPTIRVHVDMLFRTALTSLWEVKSKAAQNRIVSHGRRQRRYSDFSTKLNNKVLWSRHEKQTHFSVCICRMWNINITGRHVHQPRQEHLHSIHCDFTCHMSVWVIL